MAARRNNSLPINTYGFKVYPGWSQQTYDQHAFARKLSGEGILDRPQLFRKIADYLLPGHFEWHDWTWKVVNALCSRSVVCFAGCSNCVDGSTRILNPITGEQPTIEELCDSQIAPIVMTLNGPVQADIPYLKGIDELFEVELENGSRFVATAEHRVCVSISNASLPRFSRVSDLRISQFLLAYEPIRSQSISECDPSVRAQGVLGFQKTASDFRGDYHFSRRLYDAPLLHVAGNDQSFFPLQVDVQAHSIREHDGDALALERKHIPASLRVGRLSSAGYVRHHNSCDNHERYCCDPGKLEHASNSFLCASQYHSRSTYQQPSSGLNLDLLHRLHLPVVAAGNHSCWPTVSQSRIVSIRSTGVHRFYDISVPGPEHYFAEGIIHHNSAKTYNVAGFAANWWMCDPDNSSVTFVSTSMKSLRLRGWAEIQRFHSDLGRSRYGNFVDSRMMWQAIKGEDKHSIRAKAVEEGPVPKVADDIKGVHTKRQMVVIDEATSVPKAIYEACVNLYSYPEEFVLVLIGNPPQSKLNQFSRFCEPAEGWLSIGLETQEWEAKPIADLGNMKPLVVRFDAEESPNITEGRVVSKHLPTLEKVKKAREAGGGQTPLYWSNFRGFWPPEGLSKTVFSDSMLIKNDGFGRFIFTGGEFHIIGAFDPAFGGGDRPALRFAKLGIVEGDKWGIQVYPPIILPIDAIKLKTIPVHYQLQQALERECASVNMEGIRFRCPPENLAIDATGEGGGLCDIVQREWSPKIIRIEFGGRASEDACNLEDSRPACDVYDNKSTEMHFRARDALNSGQLKGIDPDTATELCNREFYDDGKKIQLQSKSRDKSESRKSYRTMFGVSPDLSDCCVMLLEVAGRKGFHLSPVGQTVVRYDDWEKQVEEYQSLYAKTYQAEEIEEGELVV